jgi:hypothetical protein
MIENRCQTVIQIELSIIWSMCVQRDCYPLVDSSSKSLSMLRTRLQHWQRHWYTLPWEY